MAGVLVNVRQCAISQAALNPSFCVPLEYAVVGNVFESTSALYGEPGPKFIRSINTIEETNNNWNEYEAQGKQNPYAIPNCIIQQNNSPVQAPVADTLDDNGVGYSWVSEAVGGGGIPSVGFAEVDPPCFWEWTIKPVSPQWKVSSEDFHIMTRDVQQMTANYNYDPNVGSMFSSGATGGYPSGFAYYDNWGNDINGNTNPYLHGSNGTWDFEFADQVGAVDDDGYLVSSPNNPPSGSNGIGEALLYTSPNFNGLFNNPNALAKSAACFFIASAKLPKSFS